MADEHGVEVRTAPGRKYRQRMPGDEQSDPGDPLLETYADGGRERAVEDDDGARHGTERDRLGQRVMDGDFETFDVANSIHQTTAMPPKASIRSVTMMMMITATILATGP